MTAAAQPLPERPYWFGIEEVPWSWGRSVVTLGVFDGLHRGHARLLDLAVGLGRRRGLPVVLATFDPHPATVAGPGRDTTAIVSLERRAELARDHGSDAVLVLPFGRRTAETPAVDFVRTVLVGALRATDVVVGQNFRFGHRGAGDVTLLRRLGPRHGFDTLGVPLLTGCSSTRIREFVSAGDVAAAAAVLGREYEITGHHDRGVVHPTSCLLPAEGTYRVEVRGHAALAEVRRDRTVRVSALLPTGPVALSLIDRA
jgi:riboflavin kinase / FMN adenylyltransferase